MNKVENASALTIWLDRAIVFWLFVFAIFAPHSIAVAQGAWLLGMLLWVTRFFLYPRPRTYRTPIDYALLGVFIISRFSALLSYEPTVFNGKLRAGRLFTIVFLFAVDHRFRSIVV